MRGNLNLLVLLQNHIIGLPQKDGVDKPLYDYEKIIFESLVTHVGNTSYSKHLWMKKATGLGISNINTSSGIPRP
jgi:hypothetical protein